MFKVQWDDRSMGTGVASVDTQHKQLIDMLNQLLDATSKGKGKEEIGKMIRFLGQYTVNHFCHEEQVMAEHKCPTAQANKEAHAKFLADLAALSAKFEREGTTIAFVLEVQQKIMNWLSSHIRGCDAALRKCAGVTWHN